MQRITLVLLVLAMSTLSACAANSPAPAAATASPSATPAAEAKEASPAELEKTVIDLEKKSMNATSPEMLEQLYLPEFRAIYFGKLKSFEDMKKDGKDITQKNFVMSGERVTFPIKDTALLTYRYNVESTYKGKKTGGPTLAASVWVRAGGEWKNALYTETAAAPAK
jgi:hypothetical protein